MAHSVGEVVEVLDASSGWLPARVLRRHEDGAYDVSVNLDETIHLGDAAACLSLLCAGDQESKIRAALGFYLDPSKTSLTLPALRAYLTSIFKVVFEARNFSDEERTKKPSPRSTGDATARRCFEDYGLTENESIHVDDFVQWYIDTLSGKSTTEEEEEDWVGDGGIVVVDVHAMRVRLARFRNRALPHESEARWRRDAVFGVRGQNPRHA